MVRTTRGLLLFLALAGIVGTAVAGNWERFRGPNGTGVVDDKDVPLTFSEKENLLWKVPVPGVGNSSPVVWGSSLFIQSASKDGKERTLLCLDTADGKTRWQKTIPGSFVKIRPDSSLASSTPATDGEAVYVSFWDGKDIILSAFDMQGAALWSKNLGPFISQHGAGASPILYKDKLILANDMDAYVELKDKSRKPVPVAHPSLLMALNKKTGQVMWEAPRDAERACYSAPFLLQKPGQPGPELVVVSTTAVTGYDPDSGTKKWEAKDWQAKLARMPLRTVASSAMVGDVLIACSGDGAGDRLAVAIELPGTSLAGTGKSDAPQRLWNNRKDFPYVPCPLARGEHFYFVNDSGFAGCYDARSGKRIWLERLDDVHFYASPLLINGKVYAVSDKGDVFVFAAESKYELLATNSLGEIVRATPAVADGRLYIRGERSLFCIGKK
jgi:outer membrane protein assembly factor BamB